MDRQAKVTSVDALAAFRSSLVQYLTSAGSAVDEVRDEVRRTRIWIQHDQRSYWEGKMKRLRKQLEQAEAELFTSRLSAMTSQSAARQMAVTRLRRQVRETEEKLKLLKKWNRNYDSLVEPLTKKLDGLQQILANDMPKAVAYLRQAEESLDAYTRIAPEGEAPGSEASGEEIEAAEPEPEVEE